MSRTVYVNGAYVPEEEATISVFDRGFLFADGVYEVTSVLEGKLIDFPGHLRRLHLSLGELAMPAPATDAEIEAVHRELVARNGLTEGMVYLQVTRGAADRDFAYPAEPVPSLVAFTQARALVDAAGGRDGIRVIGVPDIRWGRRNIKTVQLLAADNAQDSSRCSAPATRSARRSRSTTPATGRPSRPSRSTCGTPSPRSPGPRRSSRRTSSAREPGARVTVGLQLPVADCTIVDAAGKRIVEPGQFELLVGPSSRDEALLRAGFVVTG